MRIEQDTALGSGGAWELPGHEVMPADLGEFFDAVEESVFEAAGCGDVGFEDRVFGLWWPEIEQAFGPGWDDGFEDAGVDPDCGQLLDPGQVPADPMDRLGRVGWLQVATREHNRSEARWLAAVHQTGHSQGIYDGDGYPRRDGFATTEVGAAFGAFGGDGRLPALAGRGGDRAATGAARRDGRRRAGSGHGEGVRRGHPRHAR